VLAELVVAEGLPAEFAPRLRALVPTGGSVAAVVETIIADVAARGDTAVEAYTERFDTGGTPAPPLPVNEGELRAALTALDPAVRAGIELAITNVGKVAAAGRAPDRTVSFDAHTVTLREVPVKRAAVYVPGGRAPYPSTVVMGVVTAKAAGVEHVSVCTPPGSDGTVNPAVLAACALTGADAVYRMGGAQAIAALAYGTASVDPVDVIVGPGNLFVQEAKRQVSGRVGIDSFAGPSDLLVLLDAGTAPEPVALDLLAQAEHGPGTLVVAASPDRALLEAVAERLAQELPDSAAVCRLVLVPDMEFGLALSESFAPEHLELFGPQAEQLATRVTRAGCVFIGTGTAFGDYIAGSNHTLPTDGAARFASALGPQHFRRRFTEVRIADASALARAAAPLARAEGFELHARSMEMRISEN
jgi:histidinol dehydrogenase